MRLVANRKFFEEVDYAADTVLSQDYRLLMSGDEGFLINNELGTLRFSAKKDLVGQLVEKHRPLTSPHFSHIREMVEVIENARST